MALPGSGALSFSAIAGELGVSLSNVSLRSMSSTAGKSTPDSVSEFYGYSNLTYTYHATWAADDPCNYDYWDIYSGSNGLYYRDTGLVFELMGNYTTTWYEYLYYEPLFDANIYKEYTVSSNVPIAGGNILSSC